MTYVVRSLEYSCVIVCDGRTTYPCSLFCAGHVVVDYVAGSSGLCHVETIVWCLNCVANALSCRCPMRRFFKKFHRFKTVKASFLMGKASTLEISVGLTSLCLTYIQFWFFTANNWCSYFFKIYLFLLFLKLQKSLANMVPQFRFTKRCVTFWFIIFPAILHFKL